MNINPNNPIIQNITIAYVLISLCLFLVPRHSSQVRNAATTAVHPCTAIQSTCVQIDEQSL